MKSIKLTSLADRELSDLQMAHLEGGSQGTPGMCSCPCKYKNQGGSSTQDNYAANDARGIDPILDGGTLPGVVVIGEEEENVH